MYSYQDAKIEVYLLQSYIEKTYFFVYFIEFNLN